MTTGAPVTRTGTPHGTISVMPTPPESTRISLRQRLRAHAEEHWPQVTSLDFRYRGEFAYVDAHLPDGEVLPLLRLRYGGSARHWGFGLYLASSERYENQILPSGFPSGSPEEALDCACGLYLDNPAR
jgi:hypothetical protein